MIPKINFRFSFIYNKIFEADFSLQDFKRLKEKSRPFINLVEEHLRNILVLIEKYNNSWMKEYIPVYIISGGTKSFSDPLTLRYREDHKLLLLIFIHELIHNNLSKKYKNSIEIHKVIDKIHENVVDELKLRDFEEAREKYRASFRGF